MSTIGNWIGNLHYVYYVNYICQMSAYLLILSPCYFHIAHCSLLLICSCIFSPEETQEEGERF